MGIEVLLENIPSNPRRPSLFIDSIFSHPKYPNLEAQVVIKCDFVDIIKF